MSALDKDSGVREIPVPRCHTCHQPVTRTVAGLLIHVTPNAGCRG